MSRSLLTESLPGKIRDQPTWISFFFNFSLLFSFCYQFNPHNRKYLCSSNFPKRHQQNTDIPLASRIYILSLLYSTALCTRADTLWQLPFGQTETTVAEFCCVKLRFSLHRAFSLRLQLSKLSKRKVSSYRKAMLSVHANFSKNPLRLGQPVRFTKFYSPKQPD